MKLTNNQRHLARHALGLVYGETHSYRNRFAAARGTADYDAWRAMVDMNAARRIPWFYRWGDHFYLTRAGADLVLRSGERLDPEDFPE